MNSFHKLPATGKFLCIEGPDGSGKTTQLELLRQFLVMRGVEVVMVREPGGTVVGEGIRTLFKENFGQTHPMTEALMMLAARNQLAEEVIRPALARGAWVIADRYTPSLFAYQGAGQQLGFGSLIDLRQGLGHYNLNPDVTLFLRVSDEERRRRLAARGDLDKVDMASDDFKCRVAAAYDEMLDGNWSLGMGIVRQADGEGTPEEVHEWVIEGLFWELRELEAA